MSNFQQDLGPRFGSDLEETTYDERALYLTSCTSAEILRLWCSKTDGFVCLAQM